MSTKILDCYYKMSKDEIEKEYNKLYKSNTITWTDNDLTFPILLYAVKERYEQMSDQELSILHMYFEMRKTIGFIEFKTIYPILKNGTNMLCMYSKRDIVIKINNMLNIGIKIAPDEYNFNQTMSPVCKSHYSRCYSPSPCTSDSHDSYDSEDMFSFEDEVANYDIGSMGDPMWV